MKVFKGYYFPAKIAFFNPHNIITNAKVVSILTILTIKRTPNRIKIIPIKMSIINFAMPLIVNPKRFKNLFKYNSYTYS